MSVTLLTTLVLPSFISSLLMLLFVHYLFENSFANYILLLQLIQIFHQNLILLTPCLCTLR